MPSFRQPGLVLTDHTICVPLRHEDPAGEQIEVYAREVVAAARAHDRLPWLLFLQGGPGVGASRPIGRESWLNRALDEFRVLLLDQRGTGRSTPANRHTLADRGGPQEQADYLACFRADAIVRDAEIMRRELLGDEPWSVLGQSYGGFCAVTYLSFAPQGLREVFIAGGLPGLRASAEDVYRATYRAVAAKNAGHYERYPDDVERAKRVATRVRDQEVELLTGRRLSVRAFQTLGIMLGEGGGSHRLHYLLEDACANGSDASDGFLAQVEARLTFAGGPLYALLHEAIYAQGASPTGWAAQRVRSEFGGFDAETALAGDAPLLFTGEMIYPWMFDEDAVLRPLRETADALAERTDWPALYDPRRLAANDVPVAAVVYYDDMYVDRTLSMATAQAIRGLRPWVTNEYEHDGLRVSDGAVLDRLVALARDAA